MEVLVLFGTCLVFIHLYHRAKVRKQRALEEEKAAELAHKLDCIQYVLQNPESLKDEETRKFLYHATRPKKLWEK